MGKKSGSTSTIPFEGSKPQYKQLEIEVDTKFDARLSNYAKHYKETTGVECDLGVLIASIVNPALSADKVFIQKESTGQFNGVLENGTRPARTSSTDSK